mgnify:CR=1 FL=1
MQGAVVSIRLADAWPFQPAWASGDTSPPARFNPPCGCVAFSTAAPTRWCTRSKPFQSALRMRGLFNRGDVSLRNLATVSIRLADAWPFQRADGARPDRCAHVSIRLADAWPFQRCSSIRTSPARRVSIRLADAWPFQLRRLYELVVAVVFQSALRMRGLFNPAAPHGSRQVPGRFNPPCGCVAFSTVRLVSPAGPGVHGFNPPCGCVAFSTGRSRRRGERGDVVSIRLADAWPFQLPQRAAADERQLCFNPPCGCVAFSTRHSPPGRQARLCFNPPCGCVAFSTKKPLAPSALRAGFNPPCGCVAFSTLCRAIGIAT